MYRTTHSVHERNALIINQDGEPVSPESVQSSLAALLQHTRESLRTRPDGSLDDSVDPRAVLVGFVCDLDQVLRQQPFDLQECMAICCPPLFDSQADPDMIYVSTLAKMFDQIIVFVRGRIPSDSDEPGIMTEFFLTEVIQEAFAGGPEPLAKLKSHLKYVVFI